MLLDCTSDIEFYRKYKEIIVPIFLQKDDDNSLGLVSTKLGEPVADLVKACYPRIIARLIPSFLVDESDELRDCKGLYRKLERILTKEVINDMLTQQLDGVILNIMRMLYDEQQFLELCGGSREALCDPDPVCVCYRTVKKSLLYLQVTTPFTNLTLFHLPCILILKTF